VKISELAQESQVVFEEQANVGYAVFSHGEPFYAEAEGPAGVLFAVLSMPTASNTFGSTMPQLADATSTKSSACHQMIPLNNGRKDVFQYTLIPYHEHPGAMDRQR